ncbi:hypothetical protein [Streptomyces sp. LUP47B]|uniref:hypothetical protein n=1 Tax=Streptomyces sp. LUP47B TaxID=1890286 RepID=UPI0008519542|nr:hypothetical protein [Streptomyces sp. LUP47B]
MTHNQTPQAADEQLSQVGWWCWRGDNHGHLATEPCRSDNVPIHVPAEWADEMRAVIQRIEDGDDEETPTAAPPTGQTHGLTVQQADALWDAVAIPGPHTPTFPGQHDRVCRAVAGILAELPAAAASPTGQPAEVRLELARVLHELHLRNDFDATEDVDAVLAVLPPPIDRPDILREVADICDEAGAVYTAKNLNGHADAAFRLMERFQRKANEAEYVATPCSVGGCEPGGEPCTTHERLMAHAEGDHELCAPDCGISPAKEA